MDQHSELLQWEQPTDHQVRVQNSATSLNSTVKPLRTRWRVLVRPESQIHRRARRSRVSIWRPVGDEERPDKSNSTWCWCASARVRHTKSCPEANERVFDRTSDKSLWVYEHTHSTHVRSRGRDRLAGLMDQPVCRKTVICGESEGQITHPRPGEAHAQIYLDVHCDGHFVDPTAINPKDLCP